MPWFDWLRRAPAPVVDHPIFGRVRAAHRPADGCWSWETLDPIATARGDAFANFNADGEGPNFSHEAQWERILSGLDELTVAAAPLIADELKDWPEVPFDPAEPWDELEWQGADLFGDSNDKDEFALAYGCRHWPDAMITIYFENGRPTMSQLDD